MLLNNNNILSFKKLTIFEVKYYLNIKHSTSYKLVPIDKNYSYEKL